MHPPLRRTDIDAALASPPLSRALAEIEERLGQIPPLDQPGLRSQVIAALEAAAFARPLEADWLLAICEASPNYLRLSGAPRASLPEPPIEQRLCDLLTSALEPLPPSKRGALIGSVIPAIADMSLLCALFRRLEGDFLADGRKTQPEKSYFGDKAEEARSRLYDRVVALARSGQIWSQASAASILWFWFACGREDEVYIFVKQSLRDKDSVASMLAMLLEQSDAGGEGHAALAVRRWSRIVDFNTLETRALEILMSGAAKPDKTLARRFLAAFGDGKSELFK